MNSSQVLSIIAMILFGLAFYPLISLVLEEKDERQTEYFMNALKVPAMLITCIFGGVFIFYLLHGMSLLPINFVMYLLDAGMYFVIFIYKAQLNPDGKLQEIADKFNHRYNIKTITVLRNLSIVLTATCVFLNFKTKFIPYSIRAMFLLFAYIFFISSCYFGKKVSHFKFLAAHR